MTNDRYPMIRKDKVTFGDGRMTGILERPASEPEAIALFAQCFTCPKDILAASRISRALAARGFGVFRFDFTGLGDDENDPGEATFSTHVEDVLRAAEYLRDNIAAPKLLIGHSLGGIVMLSAARSIPEAKTVVTIGAPSDSGSIHRLLEEGTWERVMSEVDALGRNDPKSLPRRIERGKRFLRELSTSDFAAQVAQQIREMRKALLVLHSPQDEVVGLHHARNLFEAALHPKSFLSLESSDHLISRPEDAQYIADIVSAWSGKYIRVSEEESAALPDAPEVGEVLVTELDGHFSQEVRTHRHAFLADEPLDYGGADTGPSPYELLLAGLGACTAMTIRMYAKHKKLTLEKVSVRLEHEKIDAKDCPECETKKGKIDRISREIRVEGQLTPDQRRRILAIANRCPVHKTIHGEIQDRVWLAEDEAKR
uniref:Putative redox protein n=1 Tax=Candidatus Kentrum sp. MB TaxID=2138164 RepID=A0A450XNF0_9GAMM|nr:MAG: putative redox protein [Candidatus Kentron sp. MB]